MTLGQVNAGGRPIRRVTSGEKAREALKTRYKLTDIQAKAILDMQLRRLAALERGEVLNELAELQKTIANLQDLLANPPKVLALVRDELLELKKKFGDPRRTFISHESAEISLEDMIPNVETMVTISARGYAKRVPPSTYRAQRRGRRLRSGAVERFDRHGPGAR